MGLDLKQLIAQATKPDDQGNKIPVGANFGSLRVEAADEQLTERIMVTTSIYDPVEMGVARWLRSPKKSGRIQHGGTNMAPDGTN